MTEKCLLAKYKVTNQEQIKLKASLTTKQTMHAMKIVIKRFKSDVICHNDSKSLISVDKTAL